MSNKAYDELKNFAQEKHLPENYTDDLFKHDYNTLQTYDGPFIWVLRTNGTHLYKLSSSDYQLRWDARQYLQILDTCFVDNVKWYALWTGKRFYVAPIQDNKEFQLLVDEFLVGKLNSK